MQKICVLLIIMFGASILLGVQSNFSSDLEYWSAEGDGNFWWAAAGGNPGGCLFVEDDAEGDILRSYAPNKFLGDWSEADASASLSADIYVFSSDPYIEENYVFRIQGPGGIAQAIEHPTPPFNFWVNYSVSLARPSWEVIEGSWEELLQDVRSLIVTAEYVDGYEYVKIDNVTLTIDPIDLPVPIGVISDFENVGYDGWYFENTDYINNQIGGGNPNRFIYVDGNGSFTQGFAPPKFTGSWEIVEDSAAVMVDLKNISGNVDWEEPQFFIRIKGDGGIARFSVPNDFNLSATRWKTFMAYITETEWDMLSGNWDSLITDVSEEKLDLDYYESGYVIGMDNIRVNNEPPEVFFTSNATTIMPGEEVSFTSLCTNSPDTWHWDFGDSTTSFLPNPEHIYTAEGVYDVTLTAENIFGADSLTKEAYITVLPAKPHNLTITISADSVYLNWNSIPEAEFYQIYESDYPTAEFDSIAVVTDTTWTTPVNENFKKFYNVTYTK